MQSFRRIVSPAGNGNVDSTLILMDSIPHFRNPIINLKYKQTKKAYQARFIEKNEKPNNVTKNKVINDICALYHSYWDLKLINSPINAVSILYDRIAHYLVDNGLTKLSYDAIRPTIQNDEELGRVIKNEGFYFRFLYLNEIQDVLIWEEQEEQQYTIALPNDTLILEVVFIDKYANRGCLDYATLGMAQIGGWAASDSPKLFCNKASYRLNSEKFKVSYLKHEALHFIDIRSYPNLEAADLEYRSKLVELMYASKKSIYHLMYQFIVGGSNET